MAVILAVVGAGIAISAPGGSGAKTQLSYNCHELTNKGMAAAERGVAAIARLEDAPKVVRDAEYAVARERRTEMENGVEAMGANYGAQRKACEKEYSDYSHACAGALKGAEEGGRDGVALLLIGSEAYKSAEGPSETAEGEEAYFQRLVPKYEARLKEDMDSVRTHGESCEKEGVKALVPASLATNHKDEVEHQPETTPTTSPEPSEANEAEAQTTTPEPAETTPTTSTPETTTEPLASSSSSDETACGEVSPEVTRVRAVGVSCGTAKSIAHEVSQSGAANKPPTVPEGCLPNNQTTSTGSCVVEGYHCRSESVHAEASEAVCTLGNASIKFRHGPPGE